MGILQGAAYGCKSQEAFACECSYAPTSLGCDETQERPNATVALLFLLTLTDAVLVGKWMVTLWTPGISRRARCTVCPQFSMHFISATFRLTNDDVCSSGGDVEHDDVATPAAVEPCDALLPPISPPQQPPEGRDGRSAAGIGIRCAAGSIR